MFRLIFLVLIALIGWQLWSYLRRQPPQKRRQLITRYGFYVLAIVLILLAFTGRLHWLGAVIAALLPFAQRLIQIGMRVWPLLKWWQRQRAGRMSTKHLKMEINPNTGRISGTVLLGTFANQSLDSLDQQQLQQLLDALQTEDAESSRLLYAYLQQRFGNQYQQDQSNEQPQNSSDMSRDEALSILGLDDKASREDIIRAHKKLMQKVHPDRGGSDYLAAKINQAKDHLLK